MKKLFLQNYIRLAIIILVIGLQTNLNAQNKLKVLFLGNSYSGVNNLPQLVYNVALSAGDTLIYDSYTPGGYTLVNHSLDVTSQAKIMAGGWNYVVIQGQSQEPVIAPTQFYSGGLALYNMVKQYNPCAVIMPYMTWGRKNGDPSNCASFPAMCTYAAMDSVLKKNYLNLRNNLNGEISPVSVVWKYLRQNNPGIDLYDPDGSHPSTAGSYAAACCFYASILKKDPSLITFNYVLPANDAAAIRTAAKLMVYDSLQVWNAKKAPIAKFDYQIVAGNNAVMLNPYNPGVWQNFNWNFGDGTTSTIENPMHNYLSNGTFTIQLTASTCDLQGVHSSYADTTVQFCNHTPNVYTNEPWLCNFDTLWTQAADAYQWYSNGVLIPETNQYLPNYARYPNSGFTVISTLNTCAEQSLLFSESPLWSGVYFDALGDPCTGDTVAFAVLHINGFLSGAEQIRWFKNDTLLPMMNNADTLLVSGSGKYTCKVVIPNSECPFDTTFYDLIYNCGTIGIVEKLGEFGWTFTPNPASAQIRINISKPIVNDVIQIYNALGVLVKEVDSDKTVDINISDIASGFYFIRLKSNWQQAKKFIKE